MSHDSRKAALTSDWLIFFSSMARTKITCRKGEKGKHKKVRTRAEVHGLPKELPVLVVTPVPEVEDPPTLGEMERRRAEQRSWGRWEVARVITDPTVGPDGCGGQAIYVWWGGASQKEAQTDHRRQDSQERVPGGW